MTTDRHATHPWPANATPTLNGEPQRNSAGRNDGAQPGKALKQRTPLPDRIWKVLVWARWRFSS